MTKDPRLPKTILNKKNITGRITILALKLYYRATVIKQYWYKNKYIDQYSKLKTQM